MIQISYAAMVLFISFLWLLVRATVAWKNKKIAWIRELQLLLVYICIIVVVRFTFCPFGKIDGEIQPLLFDIAKVWPVRINLLPLVYLFDYPEKREILLNVIGNTTMFIPLGVIWPIVFKNLDTHKKVLAAGIGASLCIEILQLPFYDRVTDIDDLILNSMGFLVGYLIFVLVKKLSMKRKKY